MDLTVMADRLFQKLPRLRVRSLMIVVAVFAIAFGIHVGRLRRSEFLLRARHHNYEAASLLSHAQLWDRQQSGGCMEPGDTSPAGFAQAAVQTRKEAAAHERLARAYERAARWPWAEIPPDRDFRVR